MMGMFLAKIFDSNVVHNEEESDGSPFLETDAKGGELLIVSCSI